MVLQQKTKTLIWGKADKGSQVEIIPGWTEKKYKTTVDDEGKWNIRISTPKAGGPYQLTFKNKDKQLTLKNILIGEVWICSGQSNMEMPLKGYKNQPVINGKELISDAGKHPDIHVFRVPKVVSAVPLTECQGSWQQAGSETTADFSAVAYQYALFLNQKLHVPIGIISTYWGGTAIQSWMSTANLKQFPEAWLSTRLDTITNPEKDPEKSPSILFNSMILPISNYTIKGFVWYQGESNRYNPLFYKKLMPAMVNEWRTLWGKRNLPFYYVQIAPYNYYDPKKEQFSAILRESQLQALHKSHHTGMIVTLDVGKEKFIHPPDKTTVSQRLSFLALRGTYHKKNIPQSSEFKSYHINDNIVNLRFKHGGNGLILKDCGLNNFEIAGSDKVFYPAKAIITGRNQIQVTSENVQPPIAVRYAFKNWLEGTLFNKNGLPISSFRTDNWETCNYSK